MHFGGQPSGGEENAEGKETDVNETAFWSSYWECPQEKEDPSKVEAAHTIVGGVISEVAGAGKRGCEHLEDEVAEIFSMGLRRRNLKKCPGNKMGRP